jgi:hypothetical protein
MHSPLVIPHAWPTWGRLPSSAVPLQSLSMPSQVSPAGPLGFWQTQPEAPAQASEPLLHGGARVPLSLQLPPGGGHQVRFLNVQQLPGRVQQPFCPCAGASVSGASSTAPLQLSSTPLHVSGLGCEPG